MSGFLKNGTDLDNIFEPRGTSTARAGATGFQISGGDIMSRYYNLALGGSKAADVGFQTGGTDISNFFAAKGSVVYDITYSWDLPTYPDFSWGFLSSAPRVGSRTITPGQLGSHSFRLYRSVMDGFDQYCRGFTLFRSGSPIGELILDNGTTAVYSYEEENEWQASNAIYVDFSSISDGDHFTAVLNGTWSHLSVRY